jgi:hypothetical protein
MRSNSPAGNVKSRGSYAGRTITVDPSGFSTNRFGRLPANSTIVTRFRGGDSREQQNTSDPFIGDHRRVVLLIRIGNDREMMEACR